jgi:adenosine deaminase
VLDLVALPKAHLHLHLEGAMRPSTLADLADRAGVAMPALSAAPDFAEFIGLYRLATEVLREPDDLRRLLREIAEDNAADGVTWVEVHTYPPLWQGRFGTDEEALALVVDAATEAGRAAGIGMGLIVAADRTEPPADAVRWATLAAAHADGGVVVGYGLASDEAARPAADFADAFAIAKEAGLRSVPHAGELAGPGSVRDALDHLQPNRIGHGVRAVEDPAVLARLADEGIVCDVCPTSNLTLGLAPSPAEHPLRRMLEAGVRCTLNADDPLMFGSSIVQEYALARDRMGLDDDALSLIAATSLEAAQR